MEALSLFSLRNALCFLFFLFYFYIWEPFLPLFHICRREGGGTLPLWDTKVLPVHCAAGCQVKLGSTGSASVKKSILDGRLLSGKSVLIPGLILDQKLLQNDMPLAWKWTHSAVEIGWKCVRWLPRLAVWTGGSCTSSPAAETTPAWTTLKAIVVRRLQMHSAKVKCIYPLSGLSCVFHKARHEEWKKLKIKQGGSCFPLSMLNSEKKSGAIHYL